MIRYDKDEEAIVIDYAKDKSIQIGWEWPFAGFSTDLLIGVEIGPKSKLNLYSKKSHICSKSCYIYLGIGCIQIFTKQEIPMSDEYYEENMREGAL